MSLKISIDKVPEDTHFLDAARYWYAGKSMAMWIHITENLESGKKLFFASNQWCHSEAFLRKISQNDLELRHEHIYVNGEYKGMYIWKMK